MLSRVAERIYWLARYIERIENSARLAQTQSRLMFDLPKSVKLSWYTLIQITSSEEYFDANYEGKTERNCMWVLLGDRENPASLISSVWWARENIRTTRDRLPREAWVYINELHILVKDNVEDFNVRSKRNALLEKIIRFCQAINGMLRGSMSANSAYRFLKLGIFIERADMTSRIIDVGGYFIAQKVESTEIEQYDNILWATILKAIGIYFMYRQTVQIEINGDSVIAFLIHDNESFRSLKYCIHAIEDSISTLPNSDKVLKSTQYTKQLIEKDLEFEAGTSLLHDYLDEIQLALSEIHQSCYRTWFYPDSSDKTANESCQ